MQRREFLKAAGAGVAASAVAAPAVAQSRTTTFLVAHGAWSAGWAWKKMHPLMRSAGHRLLTPTYTGLGERAHLASPSNDLETHIQDMLGVLKYEDLRDVVLLAHSYGGMVATAVADRARDRIAQLIYLDAFVPKNGQSLTDLVPPPVRQAMQDSVKSGDGWRLAPNPSPPDTSEADSAVDRRASPGAIVQVLRDAGAARGRAHAAAQLHLLQAHRARGRVCAVRGARKNESGWRYFEIDASHSAQITAPEPLMALLETIVGGRA